MAANRVALQSADNQKDAPVVDLVIDNSQEIAGLAVAMKFADKSDDVSITEASFAGTRLEKLQLKEAIIDNVEKTILVYAIVLDEPNIAAANESIVKLTFSGRDISRVKFTPTMIGTQEGISLVSPMAQDMEHEFNGDVTMPTVAALPKSFNLSQNFPNPFNATTQIRYAIPQDAKVRLEVVNILGQKVKVLVDGFQTAGFKQVVWDGRNDSGDMVSSGVYFYRINAGTYNHVMKMSLLK
jgi:hypothetical protein